MAMPLDAIHNPQSTHRQASPTLRRAAGSWQGSTDGRGSTLQNQKGRARIVFSLSTNFRQ
jgi:hypothetical protein